jgi:hypothetical protein
MIAFRVKSKRKNNTVQQQKNYCYVCVARLIAIRMRSLPVAVRRALVNLTRSSLFDQTCRLEYELPRIKALRLCVRARSRSARSLEE